MQETDLKGELCAAEVRLLFLPEVVGFDDEGHTDLSGEILLQGLQQRLDELPLGTTHVDDDGETALADVLATERHRFDIWKRKAGKSSAIYPTFTSAFISWRPHVSLRARGPHPARRFILSGPREPAWTIRNLEVERF